MAQTRGSGALLLGCLLLFASGPAVAPADARVMNITVSRSGLVVHGIPLPVGAEPSLAANMSLEELQAMAPSAPDLGKGMLQAVVYQLQIGAPPDAVAEFYRREARRPVALALSGRVEQGKASTPDDGIRVLPFVDSGGYMAIRAEQWTRPSRVTVAVVEGRAVPAMVLKAVDLLRTGIEGPSPRQAPALLSPPWEAEVLLKGMRLEILKRQLEREATPGPVVDVIGSLLSQAQSVSLQSHWVQRVIHPQEILTAFCEEARRQHWRLVSIESESAQGVMALYCFPDNNGMVMLTAGRAQTRNGAPGRDAPAATEIKRLEVKGPINSLQLFRPIPVRRRPPSLTVPLFGTPRPSGPFSARPRRG